MMILSLVMSLVLAGGQSASADERAVRQREQQRVDLLTAGKLDELAAVLSPTLTYSHSNAAIDTKEKFLDSLRSGQTTYKSMKHSDVQVRFPTPDVAILNGITEAEVVTGGKPQQIPLRFTMVYVRRNGVWLMEAWQSTRRP
jgi:hypothetical protein